MSKIKELSRDIFYIRDVFMRSLQKKEEIEGEALSLVRNFQVNMPGQITSFLLIMSQGANMFGSVHLLVFALGLELTDPQV